MQRQLAEYSRAAWCDRNRPWCARDRREEHCVAKTHTVQDVRTTTAGGHNRSRENDTHS